MPIHYKDFKNQILSGDTIIVASTGSVDVLGKHLINLRTNDIPFASTVTIHPLNIAELSK